MCGLIIIFIEIPFLLRICPLTDRFATFIRMFNNNLPRSAVYGVMAVVQYVSCAIQVTSLVAAAVFLTLAALCYLFAAIRGQEFTGSSTLGGAGIARAIL